MIKFVNDTRQIGGFSSGAPISSTNKFDHHEKTEILSQGKDEEVPIKALPIRGYYKLSVRSG